MDIDEGRRTRQGFCREVKLPVKSNMRRAIAGAFFHWFGVSLFVMFFFLFWCREWRPSTVKWVIIVFEVLVAFWGLYYAVMTCGTAGSAVYGFSKEYVTKRTSFPDNRSFKIRWEDVTYIEISTSFLDRIWNTWSARVYSLTDAYPLQLSFFSAADFPVEVLLERIRGEDVNYSNTFSGCFSIPGVLSSWKSFAYCALLGELYAVICLYWPSKGPVDEHGVYVWWLALHILLVLGAGFLLRSLIVAARSTINTGEEHIKCTSGVIFRSEYYIPYGSIAGTSVTGNLLSQTSDLTVNILGYHTLDLLPGQEVTPDMPDPISGPSDREMNRFCLPCVEDCDEIERLIANRSRRSHYIYESPQAIFRDVLQRKPQTWPIFKSKFLLFGIVTVLIGFVLAVIPQIPVGEETERLRFVLEARKAYGHLSFVRVFLLPSMIYLLPLAVFSTLSKMVHTYEIVPEHIISRAGILLPTVHRYYRHMIGDVGMSRSLMYDDEIWDLNIFGNGCEDPLLTLYAVEDPQQIYDYLITDCVIG